jgi:hypothetical protein
VRLYRQYGNDHLFCLDCWPKDEPEEPFPAIFMPGDTMCYTHWLTRICFASDENYEEYKKRESRWEKLKN